jgi:very-short-patch-repair endonuclease
MGGEARPYKSVLKPVAQELRKNATRQENHLWYDFLRDFRPRFTRQRIVGSYILDFFCPKAMLAIELDGLHHYEENQMEYDNERTEFLRQYGIEVLRISNADVDGNFYAVCKKIDKVVASRQLLIS